MDVEQAASGRSARQSGHRAARSDQFEWLARAGLVARGVVYGVIGVLALKLALGEGGGRSESQQGALKTIAQGPFGKVLLVLVALGLFGYAVWRLTRAALGHGAESREDGKERVGGAVAGLAYAGLFFVAVKILVGSGSGGSGGSQRATGGVLDWPGGQVLVAVAGLVLLGVAAHQAYKGLARKFLEEAKTGQMREQVKRSYTALGVASHLARAVVFALIGYGVIRAAIEYDADKATGLDGTLAKVAQAPYGPVLLGLVAVGLLAFGAFSVAEARYRRV